MNFPETHSVEETEDLGVHVKNCGQRYASLHSKIDKIYEKLNKMESLPKRISRIEGILYTGMGTIIIFMTGIIIKLLLEVK